MNVHISSLLCMTVITATLPSPQTPPYHPTLPSLPSPPWPPLLPYLVIVWVSGLCWLLGDWILSNRDERYF